MSNGFSYYLQLSLPLNVFVVWTLPLPYFHLGTSRQVSTPYFFKSWLGIAILQVSPNLRGSTFKISLKALKFV